IVEGFPQRSWHGRPVQKPDLIHLLLPHRGFYEVSICLFYNGYFMLIYLTAVICYLEYIDARRDIIDRQGKYLCAVRADRYADHITEHIIQVSFGEPFLAIA